MKRILIILCLMAMLTGCSGDNGDLDRAMALRAKLLSHGVAFTVDITADYGDKTQSFTMDCQVDSKGELSFTVMAPESISGIEGTVAAEGGKLNYEDTALAFDLLADGQLSPVSGPWVLMNTLRSGYLTSCCQEEDSLRLAIDDSYKDDALHLDIWLDGSDLPIRGEVLWKGRRLLSMVVKDFAFL